MVKATQYFELVLAAIGMCLGQILLKKGLAQVGAISPNWEGFTALVRGIFTYPALFAGCAIGGLTTLVWLFILSRMDLSFALPMLNGIYFLLVLLLSLFFLKEDIAWGRWFGTGLILLGMAFLSKES
ncbi:MAG: hypothetical protein IT573_04280 [Deltaproteobacteria bacterium]|nr:hypothetical protein [Deltaproteobacteria bacterium]